MDIMGEKAAAEPTRARTAVERSIVQAGVAAAVAAPLLRANPAAAGMDRSGRAPVITIFDHRGCQRGSANGEYKGPAANDQDDEMLVKVENPVIKVGDAKATRQLAESISFKAKGIDGDYTACMTGNGGYGCAKPGGKNSGRGGPAYPKL